MAPVILIALLAMSSGVVCVTFRRLSTRHVGIAWWLVFGSLVLLGLVIGYRLGFDFEYHASRNLRLVSFPIPVCAFHFEHGNWVDFPSPDWFAYPAAFTNVVVVTALAVLPLLLVSMFRHR